MTETIYDLNKKWTRFSVTKWSVEGKVRNQTSIGMGLPFYNISFNEI